MKVFVVFKIQDWEKINAYSLVTPEILSTIPEDIILEKVEVADKLYTTEELEQLRDSMI